VPDGSLDLSEYFTVATPDEFVVADNVAAAAPEGFVTLTVTAAPGTGVEPSSSLSSSWQS
jgi:hypothetical protein